MTSTRQTPRSHLRPGARVPRIVVSDEAVLASIQAVAEDPGLRLHALNDAQFDVHSDALEAAAPHLIRDWVGSVLARYPHVLPGQLAELADGLLPKETL
jgi:hypothetical protein